MDKGAILAQTNSPGLEISDKARESFSSFIDYMAPYGADLLVKTLKQDLYKGPIQVLTRSRLHGRRPRHARKLDIEDRHIDWAQWPADKIIRHQKLLKTLWNNFEIDEVSIKLVWSGDFGIAKSTEHDSAIVPGTAYISTDGNSWVINTVDGKAIAVYECTVAGDESRNVNHTTKKYSMSEDENGSTRRLRTVFK